VSDENRNLTIDTDTERAAPGDTDRNTRLRSWVNWALALLAADIGILATTVAQ
jgi:hypothetical protein